MTCEIFRAADGTTTFMCCKGKKKPEPQCEVCGAMATNLCDGERPGAGQLALFVGEPETCDRLICDFHSTQPPGTAGIDYCPDCARRAGLEPGPTVREESAKVASDRWRRERHGEEAEVVPLKPVEDS